MDSFYTLKDHERKLMAKEKTLRDDTECSDSDSTEEEADERTAVDVERTQSL